jgi:hypothetical protein
VLAEHHRPLLFHVHVGQAPPTFMVDGAVAGKWHWDGKEDRVVIEPFDPLPSRTMDQLEHEAAGLADFHR